MFALDGVPFFRVSDLSVERRTQCLRNAKDRISPKHAAELRLVKAKKGAVVFPKSGAAVLTNNRGILGADGFIVSHLMALDAGPKTTPQWLYWTLCQIDMEKFAGNISYPSVKKSVVEEIEIPLPPLAEQKRITARLNRQMAAADKIRAAAEARLEDIRALPAALLRREFL